MYLIFINIYREKVNLFVYLIVKLFNIILFLKYEIVIIIVIIKVNLF